MNEIGLRQSANGYRFQCTCGHHGDGWANLDVAVRGAQRHADLGHAGFEVSADPWSWPVSASVVTR